MGRTADARSGRSREATTAEQRSGGVGGEGAAAPWEHGGPAGPVHGQVGAPERANGQAGATERANGQASATERANGQASATESAHDGAATMIQGIEVSWDRVAELFPLDPDI